MLGMRMNVEQNQGSIVYAHFKLRVIFIYEVYLIPNLSGRD